MNSEECLKTRLFKIVHTLFISVLYLIKQLLLLFVLAKLTEITSNLNLTTKYFFKNF